jgi:hypothetical protein
MEEGQENDGGDYIPKDFADWREFLRRLSSGRPDDEDIC